MSGGIEVKIDPEDINKMVSEAILKSALGAEVKEAIQKTLANLNSNFNNPLTKVIERHIEDMVIKVLSEDHREEITKLIKETLSEKLTSDFIHKIVMAGLKEY